MLDWTDHWCDVHHPVASEERTIAAAELLGGDVEVGMMREAERASNDHFAAEGANFALYDVVEAHLGGGGELEDEKTEIIGIDFDDWAGKKARKRKISSVGGAHWSKMGALKMETQFIVG